MSDDVVTRLREFHPDVDDYPGYEAADEIVRLRAVLDAIDALHTSYEDGTEQVCHECYGLWPCRTHSLLHPEEARRG